MRPVRGGNMGVEWEPLEINFQKSDEKEEFKSNLKSLSITPEELHSEFFNQAQHLNAAIINQNELVEFSGNVPELHKKIQNMSSIESIVNEFNGKFSDKSISIPLKGITNENLNIECSKIEEKWAIKLSINSSEYFSKITRTFLLPKSAEKPSANWDLNNLNIKF